MHWVYTRHQMGVGSILTLCLEMNTSKLCEHIILFNEFNKFGNKPKGI